MKKIRVLQFPLANAYSGVTQYVLQNWKFIDKTRFQFDFATLSKEKLHFEQEVLSQGCKVFHISCYAEENEKQFEIEMNQILAQGYDAVHLHTSFWKSFKVEELARRAGIPKIIIHSHNTNVPGGESQKAQIKQHMKCVMQLDESIATDFWACSRAAADWLYGNSIPSEKIVIQKNAIDVDSFRYQSDIAERVRAELGWENQFIIGHVGRFAYQKNHAFLMKVFKEVSSQNPNARLLLVGIGPEQSKVEAMIQEWNLQEKVKILGMRDDVNQLLQAVDCFALPSHFEGLGIVLVEAQAAGCICLASDVVPNEILITDKITCLPLDEKEWVQTILKLSQKHITRTTESADVVRSNGYDLKDQINIIEAGYIRKG